MCFSWPTAWLVTTEQVIRYTVDRLTDDISYTIYRKS